jgi:iron complex outermembrane recepter protein
MKAKKKMLPQAVLGVIGVALITSPAFAQQGKVEKIEVTGSNIKRVDTETAAPIQIISADEIKRSGKQTVTELLRELPINAAGGLTELSGSGSFSAGAATASLRGLGSTATLVLLNGRRIAPYGLADPNFGQSGVVNLNSIPLNTIERIEILKDGASAIYGSEAIAGVINIILKKDYRGAQLDVSAFRNFDNVWKNQTVSGSFGIGDLGKDRYNVFANFEFFQQDPVFFKQIDSFLNRDSYRRVYGTGIPFTSAFSPFLTLVPIQSVNGTNTAVGVPGAGCPADLVRPWNFEGFNLIGLTPGAGSVCSYDVVSDGLISPDIERKSAFVRGTFDISANTSIYAEASLVTQDTYFRGFPRTVGFGTGGTFNPSTGALNQPPQFLPVGHPNNPYSTATRFRGRMDAVGRQDNATESEALRTLIGFKTVVGKFDIDSGFLFNKSEIDSYNYNELRFSQLAAGINGVNGAGYFNFSSPTTGTVNADSLRINAKDKAESEFSIFDIKASGEIGTLAGGPIGMAAGFEYRREERSVTPQEEKTRGEVFGRGVATVNGSRNVTTLFTELALPVTKTVEVQLAARYDRYSDYGSSVTPKIAASWAMTPKMKWRASYASGFRAPSLVEITRSATSGFFNGVDDPRRCNRAATPTQPAVFTVGCALSIPGLIVANPLVKPEKAQSYTAGIVLEPTDNTNLSVDYYSISRRNEITFLSLTEILLNEGSTDPRYANRVVRDPTNTSPTVPGDPGAILFVSTGYDNLGETRVKGIDVDARVRFALGSWGKATSRLLLSHYIDQRGSGAPGARLVSFGGYRNAPENRAQWLNTWEIGNWVNTVNVNWVDGFRPFSNPESNSAAAQATIRDCANPNGTYLGICRVKEYVTVDVGSSYRGFKKLTLTGTIRNVANSKPSDDPLARPFNIVWYQPWGRNFVVNARYEF